MRRKDQRIRRRYSYLASRLPSRHLAALRLAVHARMRSVRVMQDTWTLLSFGESKFDPGCFHCRTPGYPHRHWAVKGGSAEQAERQPGAVMRALSRFRGGDAQP